MNYSKFLLLTYLLFSFNLFAQNGGKTLTESSKTKFEDPPEWAKHVIWYEIAIDRFRNGDVSNDPDAEDIKGAYPGYVPEGWSVSSWTKDWYEDDLYIANIKDEVDFYGNPVSDFGQKAQMRRYGGDLQGVLDKMDYLVELGVTAIYFRPLNDSPSLHKYDARNWRHIDRNLGPDPKKDIQTMNSEIPDDPKTWKWTEADKLFLKVLDEFHKRGIRVILDYSWNHTGNTFWAWEDILKNQGNSKFKDWFWVEKFDDPNTPENEFKYHGWLGVHDLPEIKETQRQDLSIGVHTFNGDIYSKAVKEHIYALTARWLDPNQDGDPSDGVDGYRLDVAAETPVGFWKDFRKHIRSINPDAYLVGEIWWEEWPDKLLEPEPVLRGDIFDAVMNYRWYRASRHFFNDAPHEIGVSEMIDSLNSFNSKLREENVYAMMNLNASFDTPRVLTSFFNKNKNKYNCKLTEDPNYKIHKPDADTYERQKLHLVHQYTYIGAPHIWSGDEMGMWGADDPSTRKPLIWRDLRFDDETAHALGKSRPRDKVQFDNDLFEYYKLLIGIRKSNPVLSKGEIEFLKISDSDKVLSYARFDREEKIVVVINSGEKDSTYRMTSDHAGNYQNLLDNTSIILHSANSTLKIPGRTALILKFHQ